ncbi:MAG: hypothetical protein MZV64_01795 [Ignavibacteriales bacterium]|nr:hypothetical protein [Ignavibacteriales bacterium]
MDEHTRKLQELLQKDALTAGEVLDGVVACFFSTNRAFVQRRLVQATPENVNQALESRLRRIFTEYQHHHQSFPIGFAKGASGGGRTKWV